MMHALLVYYIVCDVHVSLLTMNADIDECLEGVHNCFSSDNCVNSNGSFSCTCPAGYTLDMDGYSCTGHHLNPVHCVLTCMLAYPTTVA